MRRAFGAAVVCCGARRDPGRAVAGPVHAVEPPLQLKWDQLVPPAPPKALKPFFAATADRSQQPSRQRAGAAAGARGQVDVYAGGADGRGPAARSRGAELDGKRVHIGGYVVPLDFEATRVKEFLLVPFIGACIHVPPPPANQIVYVKSRAGLRREGTFEPVWVTGTLNVTPAFTGLAEAGYTLTPRRSSRARKDRSFVH